MKPFVYRFQRKLGLVKQEEQAVRQELQVLALERDHIAEEMDRLRGRITLLQDSIRNHTGHPLVPEVVLRQEFLPVLKERFIQMTEDLQQAEAKVEAARNRVVIKNRETQTFEKLRERDWQDYVYAMNREEQKLIDELANASRIRTMTRQGIGI